MNKAAALLELLVPGLFLLVPTSDCFAKARVARIAMVVADSDFPDEEYFETRAVFEREGAKVTVCSPRGTMAVSHNGQQLAVDSNIEVIVAGQFDAIVLVGGVGVGSSLMTSNSLQKLVADAEHAGKLVAAICIAPMVLAKAGLLRSRAATCYSDPTVVRQLKANGAEYVNKKVVVSGRIVTGNSLGASTEFAQTIIRLLSGA